MSELPTVGEIWHHTLNYGQGFYRVESIDFKDHGVYAVMQPVLTVKGNKVQGRHSLSMRLPDPSFWHRVDVAYVEKLYLKDLDTAEKRKKKLMKVL